jgi:hypothetical protein
MITPVEFPVFGEDSKESSFSGEGVMGNAEENLLPANPRPGLRIFGRAWRTL